MDLDYDSHSATVTLKLKKSEPDKKVKWDEETAVDNEHMNKKKSKCCCIYEKPRVFGQSDDETDDDGDDEHGCTDHCRGHRGKDYRKPTSDGSEQSADSKGGRTDGSGAANV